MMVIHWTPRQNVKLQNVKSTKHQATKHQVTKRQGIQNVKALQNIKLQNVKATKHQGIQNAKAQHNVKATKTSRNTTCRGTTQCQGYKMSCHRKCQGHICAQNLCQKVTATIIAMSTYRNLDLIQQTVFRKYI